MASTTPPACSVDQKKPPQDKTKMDVQEEEFKTVAQHKDIILAAISILTENPDIRRKAHHEGFKGVPTIFFDAVRGRLTRLDSERRTIHCHQWLIQFLDTVTTKGYDETLLNAVAATNAGPGQDISDASAAWDAASTLQTLVLLDGRPLPSDCCADVDAKCISPSKSKTGKSKTGKSKRVPKGKEAAATAAAVQANGKKRKHEKITSSNEDEQPKDSDNNGLALSALQMAHKDEDGAPRTLAMPKEWLRQGKHENTNGAMTNGVLRLLEELRELHEYIGRLENDVMVRGGRLNRINLLRGSTSKVATEGVARASRFAACMATFQNSGTAFWDTLCKPQPAIMATAGFYLARPALRQGFVGDGCECVECGVKVCDWKKEDDPMERHASACKTKKLVCPLVVAYEARMKEEKEREKEEKRQKKARKGKSK